MRRIAKILAMTVLVGMVPLGCKTITAEDVGSDARLLTGSELRTYLADTTHVWSKGGAYYAENGALVTLWEGERDSGTYSVSENGELCWHVASWGEQPCETYYHDGNSISIVYEGEVLPEHKTHEGNVLDDL